MAKTTPAKVLRRALTALGRKHGRQRLRSFRPPFEETVRAIARFVAAAVQHCERHDLLAFSNLCTAKYAQLGRPFALEGRPLLDGARMDQLCEVARQEGSCNVRWSGPTRLEEARR